ncbi:MAG TPA: cytochrome c maturation protein CcmE [Actinomycetota bacterium]|nr:cytochrome c maturation protein CcmE [Actinomycetota bacterium]
MSATKRFTLAAGVIVVSIVGLIVWSLSGTTAYYRTPSELNSGNFDGNRTVRVAGKVVPGSIQLSGATTSFAVTDGAAQVEVTTEDALPDTFADDVEVVAEGAMGSAAFSANSVLVKCPSKMEAKLAAET